MGRIAAFHIALVLLTLAAGTVGAGDRPPHFLVRENTGKADAILRGSITASHKAEGAFEGTTTISISEVYRGSFRPGDALTYNSFREQAAYDRRWLEHGVIVFLVGKVDQAGGVQWGAATDFAEFEYSRALAAEVMSYLRQTPKK
jgi:hypothetical protein